jgi:hypothetical protein
VNGERREGQQAKGGRAHARTQRALKLNGMQGHNAERIIELQGARSTGYEINGTERYKNREL